MNKNKRASDTGRSVLIQIILVVIILALFMVSLGNKINARGVRQDLLENQIAALIQSGVPGMTFEIVKLNSNGLINDLELKESRVFVSVDGLKSVEGRFYFSQYDVKLIEDAGKYVVIIS